MRAPKRIETIVPPERARYHSRGELHTARSGRRCRRRRAVVGGSRHGAAVETCVCVSACVCRGVRVSDPPPPSLPSESSIDPRECVRDRRVYTAAVYRARVAWRYTGRLFLFFIHFFFVSSPPFFGPQVH